VGPNGLKDQARHVAALIVLFALLFLIFGERQTLSTGDHWLEIALYPVWFVVLVAYFVWVPHWLLRGRVPVRDLVRGALVTALALIVMLEVASYLAGAWVDLYAQDYGGIGVVMAIFFGIGFASTAVVACAALSPVLAEHRDLRRSRSDLA